jgi:hypothetical protein
MTGTYPSAAAIRGLALSTGTAVYGEGAGGVGVFGTSSSNAGVWGNSSNGWGGYFTSSEGYGVYAFTTGTSHWDHGVYASANYGYGVYGKSSKNDGVRGEGSQTGVRGIGNSQGVIGTSTNGYGVYGSSSNSHGVWGNSYGGTGDYGGYFTGSDCRALYATASSGWFDAYFGGDSGIFVEGNVASNGDIIASGSKAGYVVDLARNDGAAPLQLGDVVTIVGATEPLLGEIPVPTVQLADESSSTAVLGVVDRMFATPADVSSIPDELAGAWQQLTAVNSAGVTSQNSSAQGEPELGSHATLEKASRPIMEAPGRFVSRAEAEFLAMVRGAEPGIAPGAYLGVVTLGSFKAIRVDASYGSILPGDLLVSSPTPGHAMRAIDPQPGCIIGKALGGFEEGQGTVPVLITAH